MNKCFTFMIMLIVALMVTSAIAETDYLADKWIEAVKDGDAGKVYGKDGILRNPAVSGTLKVDTIAERTAAGGVTIDGLTIKDGATTTTYGVGVATNSTAVEYGDGLSHKTVLTVTSLALAIADGAFDAGGQIYTFPAGRILIEGVTVNLISSITTNFNASTADLFVLGMGTTTTSVNADGTLSGTEVTLMPSTSNDTVGGTVTTFTNGVALAASAQFDGTTTAVAAFINMGIPAANDSGANTNQLAGSVITLTWKNLGDY